MGKDSDISNKSKGKRADSPDKMTKSAKHPDKATLSKDKLKTKNEAKKETKSASRSSDQSTAAKSSPYMTPIIFPGKKDQSSGKTRTSASSPGKPVVSLDKSTRPSQESRPSTKSSNKNGQTELQKQEKKSTEQKPYDEEKKKSSNESKHSNRSRSMDHGKDSGSSKKRKRPISADMVLDLSRYERRTIVYVKKEDPKTKGTSRSDSNPHGKTRGGLKDGKDGTRTKQNQARGGVTRSKVEAENEKVNKRSRSTRSKQRVLQRPRMTR